MKKIIVTLTLVLLTSGFSSSTSQERLLVKIKGHWEVRFGTAESFHQDPNVEWVEKDVLYHVDSMPGLSGDLPNDPGASSQWSLQKSEVFAALSMAAQHTSQGTSPVLVAVIDTGADLQHPDLKQNLTQGWNFAARPGDDDHNDELPNNPQDDYQHGTHVSGIIGAVQNNQIGITGIAPRVKIIPIRWMIKGSGWGSDAILAIHYAVKMGARVINASWGGIGDSKALEEAVREAESKGVLFVASAGNLGDNNDTTPRHPSNLRYSNVISVADTTESDELNKKSNYGKTQVELGAPGDDIYSTFMDANYGKLSGTSMSAAHVSGVAALMLSVNPKLTGQEIKKILMQTVTPLASLADKTITGGRVNALQAIKQVIAQKEKPFYEFGEVSYHKLDGGSFVRPDHVEDMGAVKGMSLQLVRKIKGKETPIPGINFKAQLHADSGTQYQKYISDENGMISDLYCQRDAFTVTAAMESQRYSVSSGGQPYDLILNLKCGTAQKIIFEETSDGGEVMGIWQVAGKAEKKLEKEIGLDFWKNRIEFIWPEKGDYYDGSSVHLTFGHQWDVVSHEMGHAIYDQGKIGVFGGGEHYIDRCYESAIALSEGWASFYAAWLNFDLSAKDPGFEYMVPRRAPITVENIPADVCGKSTNEWRVIGFLWDLIDHNPDGETFSKPFATLWKDTKGIHASSLESMKTHLIDQGWDAAALEGIWKLNFPASSATF